MGHYRMAIEDIVGQEVCAEVLDAVPVEVPAAAHAYLGSEVIDSAGIYSAGIAVEAAQPLETSKVTHCMFAAANTAADTVLSTADSAAASPSTASSTAQRDSAEELETAVPSADIPAVAAVTCSDT